MWSAPHPAAVHSARLALPAGLPAVPLKPTLPEFSSLAVLPTEIPLLERGYTNAEKSRDYRYGSVLLQNSFRATAHVKNNFEREGRFK